MAAARLPGIELVQVGGRDQGKARALVDDLIASGTADACPFRLRLLGHRSEHRSRVERHR